MVVEEVVQVTFEYKDIDLQKWTSASEEDKTAFIDETRTVFAERSGVEVENILIRIIIVERNATSSVRRLAETIVVTAGDMIVVVEIVIPPTTTSQVVERRLSSDLLEVNENLDSAVAPSASLLGLENAIITSTVISQKPVIASPPPPSPDNITPYTDQSLIFIVVGGCVGLFLVVFLARECNADMIRATTRLILGSFDAVRSGSTQDAPVATKVTISPDDIELTREKNSVRTTSLEPPPPPPPPQDRV